MMALLREFLAIKNNKLSQLKDETLAESNICDCADLCNYLQVHNDDPFWLHTANKYYNALLLEV